jgi:hypothetical protein
MFKTSRNVFLGSLFAALAFAPLAQAATPRAGSNELRLESSYMIPGISVVGLTYQSRSTTGLSSSSTLFGAGFAYGRFLTDNFEIGSAITLLRLSGSASSEQWSYGVSPFARAFAMVSERIAVFGGATGGVLRTDSSNGSDATQLSIGGDVGAELFIGDSWSLRLGPTYRYIHQSTNTSAGSGTSSANVYGVNWALAGYF